MTRRIDVAMVVALLGFFAAACGGEPVGRICFIGADAGNATQAIIASPALECPTRTCLHFPRAPGVNLPEGGIDTDMCTADCESDDDCEKVPESPCVTGFTCAVPVVVGPFCCRKMCICRDYIVIPDGGVPLPAACDPGNPANECCNLPGRGDLPQCQ